MPQRREPGRRGEAWFSYERRTGEICAQPVNARGWIALIGCIAGTVAAALGVFFALFPRSALLAGVAMGATIVLCVLGTIRLAIAKGRLVHQENVHDDAPGRHPAGDGSSR